MVVISIPATVGGQGWNQRLGNGWRVLPFLWKVGRTAERYRGRENLGCEKGGAEPLWRYWLTYADGF